MRNLVLVAAFATISALVSDAGLAMSRKATAPSTAPSISSDDGMAWIGKSDEAVSCGMRRGIGLDDMAAQLVQANIRVYSKLKVHDTKMRLQVCGADKGDMNGFLIAKGDVDKAISLGFAPIPHPAEASGARSYGH